MQIDNEHTLYAQEIETGELLTDSPRRRADAEEEKNENESNARKRKVDIYATVREAESRGSLHSQKIQRHASAWASAPP